METETVRRHFVSCLFAAGLGDRGTEVSSLFTVLVYMEYSGASDKGPSEIGTTSLQGTKLLPPQVSLVWRFHCTQC